MLTAAFAGLRFGELAALTRERVDLDAGTISVVDNQVELSGGRLLIGPPESEAGRQQLVMPDALVPELAIHLASFVGPEHAARVFTGATGAPIRRHNWWAKWAAATEVVGLTGFRFHDLRVRHEAPCIRAG